MRLFCTDEHISYEEEKTIKWVFLFRGMHGYLGEKSTRGKLADAFMFDEKPSQNIYWHLLRKYHPKSSLFHYYNPYSIVKIEIRHRPLETYFI